MDWTKDEVVAAVARQRARTVALCRSLTPQQWETVALPGWRVREVIAHLVSSDAGGMTGRLLVLSFRRSDDGGLSAVEAWNEKQVARWSSRTPQQLTDGLEAWGRRMGRLLRGAPSPLLNVRAPLPFGRLPLKFLGVIRVFDEWVHEQDIRRALGAGPEHDPAAVRAAARAMMEVAPQQTPQRIPAGAAGRVALRFGDLDLPPLVADLAARTFASGGDAGATVTVDAPSAMMIASGRDAWRDAETAGRLNIQGDRAAAESFMDALRAV